MHDVVLLERTYILCSVSVSTVISCNKVQKENIFTENDEVMMVLGMCKCNWVL